MQQNFPIATVIDAAGRNAQLQEQSREAGNKALLEGLQSIGQVGQSLYDTKKRVAQSLALGRKYGLEDDVSRSLEPDQILKMATIDKGGIGADLFMDGLRTQLGLPPKKSATGETLGTPAAATPASTPAAPPAAPGSGAILASDVHTTPMDTAPNPAPLMPPATGQMPVPIPAPPPSKPRILSPAEQKFLQHTADAVNKNRPVPVISQADALKSGSVDRGARIIAPSNAAQDNPTYMGNDGSGNPLLLHRGGVITKANVPGGGSVLPKSSTMPTSTTRSSSEFAKTIIPHLDEMRGLVSEADARGYIGPAAGRVYSQFLVGKVGSTGDPEADRLLGKLRAIDSLVKSGALKVHFGTRGGQQMYEHFSDMLNSGKQSAAVLNGSLDGLESFMEGYAKAGDPNYVAPEHEGASAGGLTPEEEKFIRDYEAKNRTRT